MIITGTSDVASFRNMRKDALLVSPYRAGPTAAYTHLAAFVRGAPRDQVGQMCTLKKIISILLSLVIGKACAM